MMTLYDAKGYISDFSEALKIKQYINFDWILIWTNIIMI